MLAIIKGIIEILFKENQYTKLLESNTIQAQASELVGQLHFIKQDEKQKVTDPIKDVINELNEHNTSKELLKNLKTTLDTFNKPAHLDLLLKTLECGLDGSLHADAKYIAGIDDNTTNTQAYNIFNESLSNDLDEDKRNQIKTHSEKIIRRSSNKAETSHILGDIVKELAKKEPNQEVLKQKINRLMRFASNQSKESPLESSIAELTEIVELLITDETKKQEINLSIEQELKTFSEKNEVAKKVEYGLEMASKLLANGLIENIKEHKLIKLIQQFASVKSVDGESAITAINHISEKNDATSKNINTESLLEFIQPFLKYKAQELKNICENAHTFDKVINTASAVLPIEINEKQKNLIQSIIVTACEKCEKAPLFDQKNDKSEGEALEEVREITNDPSITDQDKTTRIKPIVNEGVLQKKQIFLQAFVDTFIEKLSQEDNRKNLLDLVYEVLGFNFGDSEKDTISSLVGECINEYRTNQENPKEAIYRLFSQKAKEGDFLNLLLAIAKSVLNLDITKCEESAFNTLLTKLFQYGETMSFTGSTKDLVEKIPKDRQLHLYKRCCEIVFKDKLQQLQDDPTNESLKGQEALKVSTNSTQEQAIDLLNKILEENKDILKPEFIAEWQANNLKEILNYIADDGNLETLLGFLPKILNIDRTDATEKLLGDYELEGENTTFSSLVGKLAEQFIQNMDDKNPLKKILSQITSTQSADIPQDIKALKDKLKKEKTNVESLKNSREYIAEQIKQYESKLLHIHQNTTDNKPIYCRASGLKKCTDFDGHLKHQFKNKSNTVVQGHILTIIQAHTEIKQAIIENEKAIKFLEKYEKKIQAFNGVFTTQNDTETRPNQLKKIAKDIKALQAEYDVMYHIKQGFHDIDGNNCPDYLDTKHKVLWQANETRDDATSILNPHQNISLPLSIPGFTDPSNNIGAYKKTLYDFSINRATLSAQLLMKAQTENTSENKIKYNKMLIEVAAQTTSDVFNIHNSKQVGKLAYSTIINTILVGQITNWGIGKFLSNTLVGLIQQGKESIIEKMQAFNPLVFFLRSNETQEIATTDQSTKKSAPNITALVNPGMTLKEKLEALINPNTKHIPTDNTEEKEEISHKKQRTTTQTNKPSESQQKTPTEEQSINKTIIQVDYDSEAESEPETTPQPRTYFKRIDPPKMTAAPYLVPVTLFIIGSVSAMVCAQFFKQHNMTLTITAMSTLVVDLLILALYGVKRYNNNKQEIRYEPITIESPGLDLR